VNVPDLVGKTVAEATVVLQGQGLNVGQQTLENSDSVPLGKIISQNPAAGTSAKKGSQVTLVVSKGPVILAVPKVIGLADADAIKTLQDAGFNPVAGPSRFDKNVEIGKVIEQNPAPDVQAPKGSQVTYIVSKGAEMAVVPDVVGMTRSSAISRLTAAGFTYSTSADFSDTVNAGRVVSQDPSAGGSYPPKTSVGIVVSGGKGAKVPNVGGLDWLSAKNKITGAGLAISPSTVTSGTVQSQSPSPDKVVAPGSKVICTF
jgi:beta-lactam-binding protein with PASTA domain